MKNKIALKLTLYFSAVLLLFAINIGAVFITLFRTQTFKNHMSDMEARAVSIATALSDYMGNSETYGRGMMGGMNGYGAYLRFVDDIAMADIWIVDENLNLITSGQMSGANYNYADLPEDADKVVKEVFEGKTTFSKGFSSVINSPTLTVGTPINVDGRIVGAVLLHSPVEGIDDATMRGIGILAISLLSALLLSSVLSVILALVFAKPLNKMKNSALLLADGDYSAKTGVSQNDEIGQLAGAIDSLSEKLRIAKRESDNLDKLRGDFVANISHELKTPVTVIRGSLEALNDEVVTEPEQVKQYHQEMLSEVIILQRLVNDLLDLSKLQNADFAIEMQQLNLCDILSDAARSAEHIAKEKHIEIIQNYDTKLQTVVGDYGRLRQMLLIVLDNAVKFSPSGSPITITLVNGAVTISDRGKGISSEDIPYIFDRFYRTRTEDNKSGSGLGLAIAKQIADRHGIRVTVKSKLNEGTEFQFAFMQVV
ncbi:MAG: HAMP domain-containing sensor histidine kinase [Oscillospiraceae bacterium]|nr:HAMP domain-containing sensor histidine kinase [Oscillospiraceae bacterium]